jgi:hypothetical protein
MCIFQAKKGEDEADQLLWYSIYNLGVKFHPYLFA